MSEYAAENTKFSEELLRFFIACLIQGLEYLHSKRIIHRNIKPDNSIIDEDGYLRITDFGISKFYKEENSSDTSGTPGYIAPEVLCRQNHTTSVDYFAVGVIAYECIFGKRPYMGKNRKEIRDAMLAKQVQITKEQIPDGFSTACADFINRIIQRKDRFRLGYNGVDEIKNHIWLRDFKWAKLADKTLESPYKPTKIIDCQKKLEVLEKGNDCGAINEMDRKEKIIRLEKLMGQQVKREKEISQFK